MSNCLPEKGHSVVGAVSTVQYALLEELIGAGHQVFLQCIYPMMDRRDLCEKEQSDMRNLENMGVHVFPLLFRSDYRAAHRPFLGSTNPLHHGGLLARLYPAVRLRPIVEKRIRDAQANLVFIFWCSEGLAAMYGFHDLPKFVYYGMPDHIPALVRLKEAKLFFARRSFWKRLADWVYLYFYQLYHIKLMKDCDVVSNLCAEHAKFYRNKGHSKSLYIQNMWPEQMNAASWSSLTTPKPTKPKIVGNLGILDMTGNTFGLKFIGEQIVPRLDALLGKDGYEIHIFGKGEPVAMVRKALQSRSIKMRGFVEDIDREICSSHVFLVVNNSLAYKGSHTRFLHAWSLKACCVAHCYNIKANPEMVHGKNILLGETADDIANLVVDAIRDEELRKKIGEGGWQTYQTFFTPRAVCARLLEKMESLVQTWEKPKF